MEKFKGMYPDIEGLLLQHGYHKGDFVVVPHVPHFDGKLEMLAKAFEMLGYEVDMPPKDPSLVVIINDRHGCFSNGAGAVYAPEINAVSMSAKIDHQLFQGNKDECSDFIILHELSHALQEIGFVGANQSTGQCGDIHAWLRNPIEEQANKAALLVMADFDMTKFEREYARFEQMTIDAALAQSA